MMRLGESIGIEWRSEGIRAVKLEGRLGGPRWIGGVTLPREGEAPLGERLLMALGPVRGPVVLGLPGHQGFLRHLALPAKDPSLLRRLLEFDLERHLPLPAEKLCFDFALLGGRKGTVWNLLLVATPKHILDAAVEALGELRPMVATLTPVALSSVTALAGASSGPGLTVEMTGGVLRGEVLEAGRSLWQREERLAEGAESAGITAIRALGDGARQASSLTWVLWLGAGSKKPVETWARQVGLPCLNPFGRLGRAPLDVDPAYTAAVGLALQGLGQGVWRLNLLSPEIRLSRQAVWMRRAAAAALGLAVLWAGFWLNGYRLERRALAKNVSKIQQLAPQVQVVESEAKRIAEIRRLLGALDGARQEPSKLLLLREMTLLIPRHTWLTRISYKRGEVEIAGYSNAPQEVIPRLEASSLFQQASFAGSIERDGAQERFTIRARLRASHR